MSLKVEGIINEIVKSVIEDYKAFYKVAKNLDSSHDEEGYDIEYDTYMRGINSQVSKGNSQVSRGGKSKKSKSMKKRRKSGKRISKKLKSQKNIVVHHKLERKINF